MLLRTRNPIEKYYEIFRQSKYWNYNLNDVRKLFIREAISNVI